jgi:hypothetical protein
MTAPRITLTEDQLKELQERQKEDRELQAEQDAFDGDPAPWGRRDPG